MRSHYQARSPGMCAKHRHRRSFQPGQQRRFVKKRYAVNAGGEPVATSQHPAPYLGVTPFVG